MIPLNSLLTMNSDVPFTEVFIVICTFDSVVSLSCSVHFHFVMNIQLDCAHFPYVFFYLLHAVNLLLICEYIGRNG